MYLVSENIKIGEQQVENGEKVINRRSREDEQSW